MISIEGYIYIYLIQKRIDWGGRIVIINAKQMKIEIKLKGMDMDIG